MKIHNNEPVTYQDKLKTLNYSQDYPYDKILDTDLVLDYLKKTNEFNIDNFFKDWKSNKKYFIKIKKSAIPSYIWYVIAINQLKRLLNEFENASFEIQTKNGNKIKEAVNNFDLDSVWAKFEFLVSIIHRRWMHPFYNMPNIKMKNAHKYYTNSKFNFINLIKTQDLINESTDQQDIYKLSNDYEDKIHLLYDNLQRLTDFHLSFFKSDFKTLTATKIFYYNFKNFIKENLRDQYHLLETLEKDKEFQKILNHNEEMLEERLKYKEPKDEPQQKQEPKPKIKKR